MSVVVVAHLYPEPDHRDEMIAVVEQTIAKVHTEDGCELYAMHESDDALVMVEKWESQQALDRHMKAPALQEMSSRLAGLVAKAPDIAVLTPHPAGGAKGAL